jgi:adenylate cyclase
MPPQPRDGSFSTHADRLTLPDQPSIAVLPFQNMSSDPEQEFFADGIAEDVITALSRYPSLFVIARNSSFTYKGRAVDVKQVGRELGVRYVLEGSLRKAGERVRVTAQLVEAESGNHLWAERYDRGFADIFAVQDEITEAVTIAVAPAIARAEMQRAMRKRPENLDAWAVYQRGLWHASRATANDSTAAISCFKDAISRDPNFASAYAELYWAYASASLWFHTHDFSTAVASMDFAARSAVALDGGDAGARAALGNLLLLSAKKNDALLQNERALAISPNLAVAHFSYGCTLIYSGRSEEGLAAFNRYLRLDRFDLALFAALSMMAIGHYFCREYEKAADAARQAIHQYPAIPLTHRMLAQSLGQLGRTEEAREALTNAVALAPSHLDVYFLNRLPWHRPEDYSHLLEGLRKAGWEG